MSIDLPDIPPEVLAAPVDGAVSQVAAALTDDRPDAMEQHHDFQVLDVGQAGWAMSMVARAQRAVTANRRLAEAWRQQIDAWERDANTVPKRSIEFLEPRLTEFALRYRQASGGRIKSLSLPNGTVRTRQGTITFSVTDEDAFIAWAEQHMPEAVKVTKVPLMSAVAAQCSVSLASGAVLGKVVTDEGEVVPGVVANPPGMTARVVPT